MKTTKITLFVIAYSLLMSVASASMVLHLNTITKEFAFTGSDTGTPATGFGSEGAIIWGISGLTGAAGSPNQVTYNNDQAFTTSVGTPGSIFGFDTILTTNTDFTVTLAVSTLNPQTLSGTGIFQSYGSLTTANQGALESTIGQSLALTSGTGYSSINVVAIPEASVLGLLGFSIMVLRLRKRF